MLIVIYLLYVKFSEIIHINRLLDSRNPFSLNKAEKSQEFIGIPIAQGDTISVSFAVNVADMPLVTENEMLWAYYEKGLSKKLAILEKDTTTTDRLRSTLQKMLPSGKHTAEHASQRLGLSKRTLQRHLTAEGTTYQAVLDAVRAELSLHYLHKHDMSVDEISYLLAYRDPNSFYRAFNNWTGMTPAQMRAHNNQ